MDKAASTRADVTALFRKSDGLLGKLLASLTPEAADQLSAHATLRDVPTGSIVVENGQVSSEIGYVIEGMLGMVQVVDSLRWHIVGLLVPTDIYGRLFDGPGSYRLEALSPTKLLVFPRAEFEQVLRTHPKIERMFLVHLLDEIDAAREWLLLISGRTVVNRVASFLIILARRARTAAQPRPITLRVPLNRMDLAHYLGARKETLSRAFRELEDKGILRIINSQIFEILDLEALSDASGDDLSIDEP